MCNDYHVEREIDVSAISPRDAAQEAFDTVQRPTSSVVFKVTDKDGVTTTIDLDEDNADS